MSGLTHFEAKQNKLTGAVPSEIGLLSKLLTVDLSDNPQLDAVGNPFALLVASNPAIILILPWRSPGHLGLPDCPAGSSRLPYNPADMQAGTGNGQLYCGSAITALECSSSFLPSLCAPGEALVLTFSQEDTQSALACGNADAWLMQYGECSRHFAELHLCTSNCRNMQYSLLNYGNKQCLFLKVLMN